MLLGQIGGTSGLVEIDITTAAMIRGEMEYDVHPLNCFLGNSQISEVPIDKVDGSIRQAMLKMFALAAAEVIREAYPGPTFK